MKGLGFTLAEVLIALVILGVIAAVTVPTIMTNIKNHEHKSAFKKALSVMNQALETEYTLEGNTVKNLSFLEIMQKRANVVKVAEKGAGLWTVGEKNSAVEQAYTFVTADGFIYTVSDYSTSKANCPGEPLIISPTQYAEHCESGVVDINGKKGPNETSTYSKKVNDQFYFKVFEKRVVPGRYPHSVEPQIMYGKK